ncbi:hypothetical protein TH9_06735 [Thalassospira xiamenensis]|nr:hypothetical protein TH9_06735 [Thalassospira xiamenensis]
MLGVLFLLLFPLWIAALTGTLTLDLEAITWTNIPILEWNRGAETIFWMFLPIISIIPYILLTPKGSATLDPKSEQDTLSCRSWLIIYIASEFFLFSASGLISGSEHWYRAKSDFFNQYGQSAVLITFVVSALRIIIIARIMSEYLSGKLSTYSMLGICALISLITLYSTGNRVYLLFISGAILISLIIKRHYLAILIGIIFSVPFGLVMSVFKWIRAYMHIYPDFSISGILTGINSGIDFALRQMVIEGFDQRAFFQGITESVSVNVYYGIVQNYGITTPFLWGETLAKIFVFWIPRSFWESKPETITVVIAQFMAPSVPTLSLVTTIFGEFYVNFGLISLLILPISLYCIDRTLSRTLPNGLTHNYIMFISGFAIIRFPVADFIIYVIIAAFILWMNRKFSRFISSRKNDIKPEPEDA